MPQPLSRLQELQEIAAVQSRIAAALDKGDYDVWMSYFLADAPYSATTVGNHAVDGPSLFMDFGQNDRRERVAFWLGMWQVGRARIRHILSYPVLVADQGDTLRIATPFLMTRTGDDGTTNLHVSGIYNDDFVSTSDGWRIAFRRVVVDCDVLPSSFTDPL